MKKNKNEVSHPIKYYKILTPYSGDMEHKRSLLEEELLNKGRVPVYSGITEKDTDDVPDGLAYSSYIIQTIPTVYVGRRRVKNWKLVNNIMQMEKIK